MNRNHFAPILALALATAPTAFAGKLTDAELSTVKAGAADTNTVLLGSQIISSSPDVIGNGNNVMGDLNGSSMSEAIVAQASGGSAAARDQGRALTAGANGTMASDFGTATSFDTAVTSSASTGTTLGDVEQGSGGSTVTSVRGNGGTGNSATATGGGNASIANSMDVSASAQQYAKALFLTNTASGNVGNAFNLHVTVDNTPSGTAGAGPIYDGSLGGVGSGGGGGSAANGGNYSVTQLAGNFSTFTTGSAVQFLTATTPAAGTVAPGDLIVIP